MPSLRGAARKAPDEPRVLMTTRRRRGLEDNASRIAPAVGGLFFPQNQALGIDHTGFSPRVQQKIVHAGVNSPSYQQGAHDLAELSDLKVKPKPVERIVRKIGQERIAQRDAAVAAYERLPLMAKDVVANPKRSSPSVAMVSVDGGRLQIRSAPSEPKTRQSLARVQSLRLGNLSKRRP